MKHTNLFCPFVSYEENKVFWVRPNVTNLSQSTKKLPDYACSNSSPFTKELLGLGVLEKGIHEIWIEKRFCEEIKTPVRSCKRILAEAAKKSCQTIRIFNFIGATKMILLRQTFVIDASRIIVSKPLGET